MSQSRAVKKAPSAGSGVDLSKLDLLYAFLLHALILILVLVLSFWKGEKRDEPLQRIEVMMISAKQLSKIEQQSRRKVQPVKRAVAKPKAVTEPPKPKSKAKPVFKLPEKPKPKAVTKPVEVAKPAPKAVAKKVEEDFDPFAPIGSTTDRSSSTNKASTSRPDIANLKGQQLSKSEIERYVALMQAAVQDQWKVPASSGDLVDPVVEMELARNGSVVSAKIVKSSGNDMLDASLVRAIHAAAPFQLPKAQFEYFRRNRLTFRPIK